MADKIFNAGDFLKRDSKHGSFMIYEGQNISDSSYKKMTLLCYFDPEKYMMTSMGYHQVPNLEVSKKGKRCSETIDTEKEDYWVKVCSPKEKEELAFCEFLFSMLKSAERRIRKKIIPHFPC